jgi:hypothetical protein
MRLALALKVAVVEEDTAVAEEDEVVAEEDKVVAEEDKGVAEEMAEDAVANRLAPICVAQFNQDSEKTQKLKKLEETDTYKIADYLEKQGWATMPGEEKPDSKVAEACVKLLMEINK